jgi:hypothetical protein
MWVAAFDAACSHLGVVVTVGPADASEDEIRAAENCVAGVNWIQYLSSDIMLNDTSSVSPII